MSHLKKLQAKVHTPDSLQDQLAQWRLDEERIVFTNGCFDIVHFGHVDYLAKAADLGTKFVLGLNTDASVQRQDKGPNRPINDQNARASILAGMEFIDAVVFFDDDTPIDIIAQVKPDVLVKGADYDPEEEDPNSKKYIVGSDIVREHEGAVVAIEFVEGYSTTNIINRILGGS